jgi:hypothetical protein
MTVAYLKAPFPHHEDVLKNDTKCIWILCVLERLTTYLYKNSNSLLVFLVQFMQ